MGWAIQRLKHEQSEYLKKIRRNLYNSLSTRVLRMSRFKKRVVAMCVDALLCLLTVLLALFLRLGEWVIPVDQQWLTVFVSWFLAIPIFIRFGLYRAIFRYSGAPAFAAVTRACATYTIIYATFFTLVGIENIPRTIGLIQPILLYLAVGASRTSVRFLLGEARSHRIDRRRVLIYGAGAAGLQMAAALAPRRDMRIVGFIDDDRTLQGSLMNGLPIYAPDDLEGLAGRHLVSDVLLAIPSATRRRRNQIIEAMRDIRVIVRTMPDLGDLAHGRVSVADVRELDIDDLLGRNPVPPNHGLLAKNITDKTVVVTGAGGSIGSELCRQILGQHPAIIILIEMNEFALYSIHQELLLRAQEAQLSVRIVPYLASVLDPLRIRQILSQWSPNTIYHAAAYKHVPLVEHNPSEGVRNNVFGTLTIAEAAIRTGVQDFVLISTDKAVRPTNTMGASKRLAEMILQSFAQRRTSTRFSMVRFGNVLNSSGSVVPLFRNQISRGGPVTITDRDITRYFMTIPEAAQLVIQAGAMAAGGEVFILDMGEPVKIYDLARNMIALSGLKLRETDDDDGDIEIAIIGLRPGEKLHEELLIDELAEPTGHPRIMMATDRFLTWPQLRGHLDTLQTAIANLDIEALHAELRRVVPEFAPQFAASDWLIREPLVA